MKDVKMERAILNQMVGKEITVSCEICNEELKMVITKDKTIKCKKCHTEYSYEAELEDAVKQFKKMGVFVG